MSSENGGELNLSKSVTVLPAQSNADLVPMPMTMNPTAPILAPGATFSVGSAVQNVGTVKSASSVMRFYLSTDAVKGAGDTLLTGSRAVPGLAGGASNSPTAPVTLTIPAATPLNAYYVLACADDLNAVTEGNEGNNCVATASAVVTVTRADLVATATSALPATKKRGTTFAVTDTTQNLGVVGAGASATRHFLSLDPAKSTNDILLGTRSVPAVVAGTGHQGTVTVTIPAATAPNAYYLLTCADASSVVVETNEANNCTASAATMTVTP